MKGLRERRRKWLLVVWEHMVEISRATMGLGIRCYSGGVTKRIRMFRYQRLGLTATGLTLLLLLLLLVLELLLLLLLLLLVLELLLLLLLLVLELLLLPPLLVLELLIPRCTC